MANHFFWSKSHLILQYRQQYCPAREKREQANLIISNFQSFTTSFFSNPSKIYNIIYIKSTRHCNFQCILMLNSDKQVKHLSQIDSFSLPTTMSFSWGNETPRDAESSVREWAMFTRGKALLDSSRVRDTRGMCRSTCRSFCKSKYRKGSRWMQQP